MQSSEHCTVAWRHRDGELVVLGVLRVSPGNNPSIVRDPLSRVGVKRRKGRREGGREGRRGSQRGGHVGRIGEGEKGRSKAGKRKGGVTTSQRGSDPRSRNGDVEVQAQAK